MNSTWPLWVANLSSTLSIIGFIVTCFLLWEARKIRDSFIRKARIPEIVGDLDRISGELVSNLKSYKEESRAAQEKIHQARALLESIKPKIPEKDRAKIDEFISNSVSSDLDEDSAWNLYSQLSGVVTYLQQLAKDTRWD